MEHTIWFRVLSDFFAISLGVLILSFIFIKQYKKRNSMICPKCEKQIEEPTDFCPSCKLALNTGENKKGNENEEN